MAAMSVESEGTRAISVRLDRRQFSRRAATRAAYWFSKSWFVEFSPEEDDTAIVVNFRAKEPTQTTAETLAMLSAEFHNAVLDAELRCQIEEETANVRELILAKAFSEAGVLEVEDPIPDGA